MNEPLGPAWNVAVSAVDSVTERLCPVTWLQPCGRSQATQPKQEQTTEPFWGQIFAAARNCFIPIVIKPGGEAEVRHVSLG